MRQRVLVADDHRPGLELAQTVLEQLGVEVISAVNGVECVKAFLSCRVSMVFVDHHMPNMTGLQAIAEIRRIERIRDWPRTPIIALTASAYPSEIAALLDGGADDVLTKPYRIEKLGLMLSKWIAGPSLSSRSK